MVDILDASGRPIRRKALTEPQTAQVGGLVHEFAAHPSRGLTPAKLARILEAAERGDTLAQLDLFEDIEEKDGHVFAELSKRRRALLGLDWEIVPPRNPTRAETAATEVVAELVAELSLADIILDMADAIGKGFACLEMTWAQSGGEWYPVAVEWRPQRWFQLPQDNPYTDELRLRDNSAQGAALQPFGWIVHRHKARSGYVARASLGRILAWPYLFKNYSVRDLAEFLEIYGLPLRLGTYPPGASDKEKATLLRAVMSIGHAAAGIIPEGMAIEFQEAAKGASGPYRAMMDWCERTQSKAILGQTLSAEATSTGLGSGVANLQGEVMQDLLVSDDRQIAATLTRDLIYPMAVLNTSGISGLRRAPRLRFRDQQPEDLTRYAQALPPLSTVMRIPEKWAHEKLQIPEPEDGEPVLEPRGGLGGFAPAKAALKTAAAPQPDAPAQMAERADSDIAPALDEWIDRIRALVEGADSLEAIRDGLLDLYPDMSLDDYAAAMREALAAAELAGRAEIMDQANGRS